MSTATKLTQGATAPDFDPAALSEKYRVERDRRLRADGDDQYIKVAGSFAHFLDDPYADPHFTRPACEADVQVLIVGGGFSGLLAAARLHKAGIHDIRMIEKAGDFGGTWYWNRYPGAACDTESYIYLPLLEETGYMPGAKYACAPEIFEHARRIGRHFGLYNKACFQTEVSEARWQPDAARWRITTSRGDVFRARFLVLAGGLLHVPKLPGIDGVQTFRGHSFHTTRWDYAYTGGSSAGGLTGLRDKRVGIIGTGATAVQCVPHLGEWSRELFVFQRTPSSVDERNDSPTDPAWAAGLATGWQDERMANFSAVISGGDFDIDMVNDGWTAIIGDILLAAHRRAQAGDAVEDPEALMRLADDRKMEQVRARIGRIVRDNRTAEALKPWYRQFCKRPCFHDQYLDTFNRPNVHLVDTEGKGVTRITPNGAVAAGREYPLDCLIYATGFEISSDYTGRIGFDVIGRNGVSLREKWSNGPETLHGLFTRGFPNAFIVTISQTGQSANFQHMLSEQAKHIAYVISTAEARGVKTLEPTSAAEAKWVNTIVQGAKAREPFLSECTPGYYNSEGRRGPRIFKSNPYWGGPMEFIALLERWREDGTFPGLEVTR
jgi:cyclohexanone monooxygenase